MNPEGRSAQADGAPAFAGLADRPTCPRCGSFLRAGHEPDQANPHGLCDPCLALVRSCAPFAGVEPHDQAPPDVNLLELVAGIMLTHDALHPGEPLYLREALAEYGVVADNVDIQHAALKLRNRHGLTICGEPRVPGYRVESWEWTSRRVRDTLGRRRLSPQPLQPDEVGAEK